jgi:hypothetical protein
MARHIRANLVVPSLVDTPLGREASRQNPGRTESPRRVRRLDLLGECPAWDEQRRTTRMS